MSSSERKERKKKGRLSFHVTQSVTACHFALPLSVNKIHLCLMAITYFSSSRFKWKTPKALDYFVLFWWPCCIRFTKRTAIEQETLSRVDMKSLLMILAFSCIRCSYYLHRNRNTWSKFTVISNLPAPLLVIPNTLCSKISAVLVTFDPCGICSMCNFCLHGNMWSSERGKNFPALHF